MVVGIRVKRRILVQYRLMNRIQNGRDFIRATGQRLKCIRLYRISLHTNLLWGGYFRNSSCVQKDYSNYSNAFFSTPKYENRYFRWYLMYGLMLGPSYDHYALIVFFQNTFYLTNQKLKNRYISRWAWKRTKT